MARFTIGFTLKNEDVIFAYYGYTIDFDGYLVWSLCFCAAFAAPLSRFVGMEMVKKVWFGFRRGMTFRVLTMCLMVLCCMLWSIVRARVSGRAAER